MRRTTIALALIAAWFLAVPTGSARQPDDREHAELAKALKAARISLERGLTAVAKEGKPISAKYAMEHGKLQLSVYAMKADRFSEVRWPRPSGPSTRPPPRP